MFNPRRTDYTTRLIAVMFEIYGPSVQLPTRAYVKAEDIAEFTDTYNCKAIMALMEYTSDGERFETFAKSWFSSTVQVERPGTYPVSQTVRIGGGAYGDNGVWRREAARV